MNDTADKPLSCRKRVTTRKDWHPMVIGGLYRVTYQLLTKTGKGVVYLKDNELKGGSSVMFYSGTYTIADDQITIDVRVSRHSKHPDLIPVDGLDDFRIFGTGQIYGSVVSMDAEISELPGVNCPLSFERLSD